MEHSNIAEAVKTISSEQSSANSVSRDQLIDAIETVVQITSATYTRESENYAQARTAQSWERDAYMTEQLLLFVRSRIERGVLSLPANGKWRLLDVGAGYGRDVLRFLKEPDIDPVALEIAPGFIDALRQAQASGQLGPNSVVAADMRDLSAIPDSSFHCVRNHATLHHLPIVRVDMGADIAVEESRRVLVEGGIFYVLVKAGHGVNMIDTHEGLGGRFFQLFTSDSLRRLLQRHGFSVVHMEELVEPRGSTDVPWVFALALAS